MGMLRGTKNAHQYLQIFKFKEIYMILKYLKPLAVALLLSVLPLTISSAQAYEDPTDTRDATGATIPDLPDLPDSPRAEAGSGDDVNPAAIEATSPVVGTAAKEDD
jgi:hypothetical protein